MTGRAVAATSGKGGVGKTMLVAQLGARLARKGRRIVLIDMNTGMRGLDMALGLESRIGFDLGDVLDGRCGLDRALVEERSTGVRLIAAKQFSEDQPLNERTLKLILEVLCLQNELVLIDMPAGMTAELGMIARLADMLVYVTTPDDASLRNTERLRTALRAMGEPEALALINRVDAALVEEGLQHAPDVCRQVLDLPLLGAIPEDGEIERAMLGKAPLEEGTRAGGYFDEVGARLFDGDAPGATWQGPEPPKADAGPPAPEVAPEGTPRRRGILGRFSGEPG